MLFQIVKSRRARVKFTPAKARTIQGRYLAIFIAIVRISIATFSFAVSGKAAGNSNIYYTTNNLTF
jgi:hypothetical protein